MTAFVAYAKSIATDNIIFAVVADAVRAQYVGQRAPDQGRFALLLRDRPVPTDADAWMILAMRGVGAYRLVEKQTADSFELAVSTAAARLKEPQTPAR